MKNITFNEPINLFLEKVRLRESSAYAHKNQLAFNHNAYECRLNPLHACRVPKTMKDKFFTLRIEVWNESFACM